VGCTENGGHTKCKKDRTEKTATPSQGKVSANDRQDSEQKKAARFWRPFLKPRRWKGILCIQPNPRGRGEHFIGCFSWTATVFSGHAHNSDHWHQASNRPPSAWLVAARARHPFGRELWLTIKKYESAGDYLPPASVGALDRLVSALEKAGVQFDVEGAHIDRAATMKAQVAKEIDRGAAA
jgi:hypothetical protein